MIARFRRSLLPRFAALCLFLGAGPGLAEARTILCVGDSITFGYEVDAPYPFQLGLRLPGDRVINAGIPGEFTAEGRARLAGLLRTYRPSHVAILHGANNVTFFLESDRTLADLLAMADLCWAYGAIPILGTVTPQVADRADRRPFADELNRKIRWNRRNGSYLVADISLAFGDAVGLMQSDGLHPNDKGMKVIAQAFYEMVLVADQQGVAPRWNETFDTWLYPQDGGRYWSYDYFVLTPEAAPGYSHSSDLGWIYTGGGSDFLWTERFGWVTTGSANGETFLYSADLQTWIDTRWDGSYYSFDYDALIPAGGFERYRTPVFGPAWVGTYGGWILSDRFGWTWADRTQPHVWYFTEHEGWLGLDPGGSGRFWSVDRGRWIPAGG